MHCSPSSGSRWIAAAIRPSTTSPRPGPPTAYAPAQSIAAHTTSADTSCARHGAACRSRPATGPTWMQSPSLGPDPAGEALGEVLTGKRTWRVAASSASASVSVGASSAGISGPRLGDECLPVEQEHAPVLLGHGQRPVERRRQPQRHLGRAVDEGCEAPRRVAAVG